MRNWTQPGLPDGSFRVSLRGATAQYRSLRIEAAQESTRLRMLSLLNMGPLVTDLVEMRRQTRIPPNYEYCAYNFDDGRLADNLWGEDRGSAPVPLVPAGNVIGYVHSHPTPSALFPSKKRVIYVVF